MRNSFRIALAGIALAVTATPALAARKPDHGSDRAAAARYDAQIGRAERRLDYFARRDQLSASQYRDLRAHSTNLRGRLASASRDGLTRRERIAMVERIDDFRERVRDERAPSTR